MALVADASVSVAWFVKSQATGQTEHLLDRATRETVHVPALWFAEFANALLVLERRRRIPSTEVDDALRAVADLEIVSERDVASSSILASLGRQFGLTAYDAAYLHLAMRLKLPLACYDTALRNAAARAGVKLA